MIIWIVLIICAYLLGSVPVSYLAGRFRGIDLRQHGTKQVGGGNLWRTTSRKLGLLVGIFDFAKGMLMVWVAYTQGLDASQQLAVGLGAVVGHNWPVFLHFHGGRGIATTIGIILILPIINDVTPWPTIAFWIILLAGVIPTRKTPVPILIGLAATPIVSWACHEPLSVTLGFLAIFLVIVIKRLTAQPSAEAISISTGRLLLNRFLFDRDISDRKAWISRKPVKTQEILEDLVDTDEMRDSSRD
jgi:glycerol-3-phosphate acyltransferase PlsY